MTQTTQTIDINKIVREIRKELFNISTTIITEPRTEHLPKDISTVQQYKHKRFNTDVSDFGYLIKDIINKHGAQDVLEVSGRSGLRSASDILWVRETFSNTNLLRISFRPGYMNMNSFHKKYWTIREIKDNNTSTVFHYNISSPNNNCMYYYIMYNEDRYLYPSKVCVRIIPDIDGTVLDEKTSRHVHDSSNDVYKKDDRTVLWQWEAKHRYERLPRYMKEFEFDML